jgi:insecticidal toxin complex protein TccC
MNLHSKTPRLLVNDPRGLTTRTVDYCRAQASLPAEARIQLTLHDASGRATQQWDPRLWRTVQANLVIVYSISNKVLSSVSVDAGWRVNLAGDGEQLLEQWDGRGTRRQTRYDQQLRPLEVIENEETTERLFYGDEMSRDHNQCGRLIRHEDLAGILLLNEYGLNGAVLEQERRLIHDSLTGHVTRSRLTPLGDLQIQTDAQANTQRFSHTREGRLRGVDLQLSNTTRWLPMASAITYNADGQVEKEVAGNGVVTALEYFAEDGRLKRLQSHRGQHECLQDLSYAYDSVGNVLCIEYAALPIRYFANQRIEPINRYRYDSLSQLIEATGWEAGTVKYGALAEPSRTLANYRQTYRYDEASNLLELTHFGACNPSHRLVAASHSNRCLPVIDAMEPGEDDFRDGFDANGNLLMLQRGVSLRWNRRNQLDQVHPVERSAGTDDSERYRYGADGMRVRKIRVLQTSAQANIIETVYLPGLEIRTHSGSGEELHVIDIRTGRGSVRVLHWEAGRPSSIANNQQRHALTDHLGSGTLELDQDALIITRENYYPFGGTAWTDGEAVQVRYKTHRYAGKERDATGLDYYGFRYYASERQRWLNPDPAGDVDGLNLYRMVRNQPLMFLDRQGLTPVLADAAEPTEHKSTEHLSPPASIPIMYRVDYLKEQLTKADEASQGRAKQVEDNFAHKVNRFINSVYSEPKVSQLERPSKFFNIYSPSEWEFKDNYKYADSGGVFLNDVSRQQIRLAADLDFLPSKIRRSKVRNEMTLSKTDGLESGSEALREIFFTQTPNGKATQRLMDDVGLKATAVFKEIAGKNVDFVVAVEPVGPYQAIFSNAQKAPFGKLSRVRAKGVASNVS